MMGPDARGALPTLVEILKDETEQHSIRILAAKAIGHMGRDAKAAIPSLSTVSVGQDKLFKKAVQKALEEIREALA